VWSQLPYLIAHEDRTAQSNSLTLKKSADEGFSKDTAAQHIYNDRLRHDFRTLQWLVVIAVFTKSSGAIQ
jgi:hypothetical protein